MLLRGCLFRAPFDDNVRNRADGGARPTAELHASRRVPAQARLLEDARAAGRRVEGGRRKTGAPRYFCVQKHLASRLHYDLRLEHDGELLSWAVPKGPSLNPADKRMAVRTEDHPFDYGDFEGVIPAGYGAGVVMLWDYGTWAPASDDVDGALARGDLKFVLDGYKLKGSWALVRTRDRSATPPRQRGRNWLLIKHRDYWSGALDVTQFAPLSVKSEGAFEDTLAGDMPALWRTGRPAGGGTLNRRLLAVIEGAARKIRKKRLDAPR